MSEPEERGHGIARHLMAACLQRAAGLDAPVLCLHTAHFMTAAMGLYRQPGFSGAPLFDVDVRPHLGVEDSGPIKAIGFTRQVRLAATA